VALALCLSTGAFAQNWPDKPIRIVVGFAPGGFTDVLARTIGQKLQERLGQSVVVDNKAGAAGTVGADIVAKARPDGYTLLLGHSNSNSVAPAIYPKLPYDVVKDFTPIIRARHRCQIVCGAGQTKAHGPELCVVGQRQRTAPGSGPLHAGHADADEPHSLQGQRPSDCGFAVGPSEPEL
jgi:tripartite-type tricarboxylate transporter receptor subunit TctC